MAVLSGVFLHTHHVLVEASSSRKLNFLQDPITKFEASRAEVHGFKRLLASPPKTPPTRTIALKTKSQNKNDDIGIIQPLSLDNNCNSMSQSGYRQSHAEAVKLNAFKTESVIGNTFTAHVSKNQGSLRDARKMFEDIPNRTLSSYAALIWSYCRSGQWEDVFSVFALMVNEGLLPDRYLVPTILKAFSVLQILRGGKMIHGYVIRKELESDVFIGNALIDFYSKCCDLRSAVGVFDLMKVRDVVSFTALVSAYMGEGRLGEAIESFARMELNGLKPDLISWNALISGFAQNGEIDLALKSLKEMQDRGLKPIVNSWNGIIAGCVQNGFFQDALDVLKNMLRFPEDPNSVTVASVLPACAALKDLCLGRTIHGYALKHDLQRNVHVEGSLIHMYTECQKMGYAEKIFVKVEKKNTAIWNEIIAAHVNVGKMGKALQYFRLMQDDGLKPDLITYNTLLAGHAGNGQTNKAYQLLSEMQLKPNIISLNALISGFQQSGHGYEALKLFQINQFDDCSHSFGCSTQTNSTSITGALAACADLGLSWHGKEIHSYVLRNGFDSNVYVSSALVNMYAKCHDMDSAGEVFGVTKERNTVSWNVLMSGYIKNRQPEMALKLYYDMLHEGQEPSPTTMLVLLPACKDLGALKMGWKLHSYIIKKKLQVLDNALASSLIHMYSQNGSIADAKMVFDHGVKEDVVLWNAMISAYSSHGMTRDAIALFEQLELIPVVPDRVTFLGILLGCAHHALVEEGFKYFELMENKYGIKAELEHYTCIISILCAAGLEAEALEFTRKMPCVPDACVWATLLQAWRAHLSLGLGNVAAKALPEIVPQASNL